MVLRSWSDFKPGDRVLESGIYRILFTCPYGCGKPVSVPDDHVINRKDRRCHDHLMRCQGIEESGNRACDDERVAKERVARSQFGGHLRSLRKGGSGTMIPLSDAAQEAPRETEPRSPSLDLEMETLPPTSETVRQLQLELARE